MGQINETRQSVKSDLGLNPETLTAASRMTDPSGVLSLYAGRDSSDVAGPEDLRLDLDVQFFSAIASVEPSVAKELYALRLEIDRIIADLEPGTGRALFYGLETGQVLTVFNPVPFDPVLVVRSRAFLLPLLCAVKQHDVVGVVAFDGDHITVVEAEPGRAETIAEYGPDDLNSSGEASGLEDRIALDVHQLGGQREWGTLVVAGDAKLTDTVKRQLQELGNRNVLTADKACPHPDPKNLAQYAVASAAATRAERETTFVSELIYQAVPHGEAVCGLDGTMKAMVGHAACTLLFSSDSCRDIGWRFNECLEQMVELALRDGAEVLPLSGDAAMELSRCEGYAARLRSPYGPSPGTPSLLAVRGTAA